MTAPADVFEPYALDVDMIGPAVDDLATAYRSEVFETCELCGIDLDELDTILCRRCGPVCKCERGSRGPDGFCWRCRPRRDDE